MIDYNERGLTYEKIIKKNVYQQKWNDTIIEEY